MKRNAQIAIEFMLILAMAFAVITVFLIVVYSISESNSKIDVYYKIDDLGKSLQQEFLLAAELEDGYTRRINLPLTLNGIHYDATLGTSNSSYSYFILSYDSVELFYMIPPTSGNFIIGDNVLVKQNGTLRIN